MDIEIERAISDRLLEFSGEADRLATKIVADRPGQTYVVTRLLELIQALSGAIRLVQDHMGDA
jgi:hypothetical protein